ncbi:hypothetical protein E2C01_057071 [Portunus trituberculatus]|uniref:Uncharacterized protein n=1 Tax=Portunus trituberculatus TaxID=210409 RepID=A0A5B7GZE2_PORTR|nr:hypothetical protein [Portunus trituberculatus]
MACRVATVLQHDAEGVAQRRLRLALVQDDELLCCNPWLLRLQLAVRSITTRQTHRRLEPRKRQVAWYAAATDYQPLDASLQQPRADGVLLQRIRLGFCTKEELYDGFEGQECEHCGRQSRRPLLHYLLSCPVTAPTHPACSQRPPRQT